jgi:hypothetical protein
LAKIKIHCKLHSCKKFNILKYYTRWLNSYWTLKTMSIPSFCVRLLLTVKLLPHASSPSKWWSITQRDLFSRSKNNVTQNHKASH